MIGWVTGTADLTHPDVAAALAESGAGPVETLTLIAPPAFTPTGIGVHGAVRVMIGSVDEQLLISANVDDLDPRVWPGVLAALLAAGAMDAWLTPILMKKGRPAHTITALVAAGSLASLSNVLLTETTSIGLRVQAVGKLALAREERTVTVGGATIRVKLATDAEGTVVNVMPEWDDIAAAAAVLGRPARRVLAEAHAAAAVLYRSGETP